MEEKNSDYAGREDPQYEFYYLDYTANPMCSINP